MVGLGEVVGEVGRGVALAQARLPEGGEAVTSAPLAPPPAAQNEVVCVTRELSVMTFCRRIPFIKYMPIPPPLAE